MLNADQATQKWQEKMFSPGKISQPHFLLQGKRITCRECHKLGKKITNQDCQECHGEDWFATKGKFYEQSHRLIAKRPCLECHIEHQGYETPISLPFREQEHKSIPMPNREECITCHITQAKIVHPNNINYKCLDCHDYIQWEREDMDHVALKPKSVSPAAPYRYCLNCHIAGFHYTNVAYPDPTNQCRPCHRKKKTMVLPPGY